MKKFIFRYQSILYFQSFQNTDSDIYVCRKYSSIILISVECLFIRCRKYNKSYDD